MIEMFVYMILMIIGVFFLFINHPEKHEISIPSEFKIQWEGEPKDVTVPYE